MKSAGHCWKCKCEIWLPDELYDAAHRSPSIQIFCGYGHPGVFAMGETEAEKLRRERDRLQQWLAQKDDEIIRQRDMRFATERRLSATRGVVTRLRNRVGHGVCPCCNRHFTNLERHIAGEHPDFVEQAAE